MSGNINKVLLVEDDQEQLLLYKTFLSLKGYKVDAASDKSGVIATLKKSKPDLIVMDIILQGENGLDIIESIRQEKDDKDIPVFIFTNTNKKEFRERAQELGVTDFIIKSETVPQELAEKIKSFLDK